MKIASIVNEEGLAVPYSERGILEVYAFEDPNWICIHRIVMEADESTLISEIRTRIKAMIQELGDCKVLVVETMKCLPIAIFDGYGITVWNHKGQPLEAFDFIKMQEEHKAKQFRSCCDKPSCKSTCSSDSEGFIPTTKSILIENMGEGYFKIDLVKMLSGDHSLNSKQILIPFFQNTSFQKLEIICQHLPKWFENEFKTFKLHVEIKESGDGLIHAIICSN